MSEEINNKKMTERIPEKHTEIIVEKILKLIVSRSFAKKVPTKFYNIFAVYKEIAEGFF